MQRALAFALTCLTLFATQARAADTFPRVGGVLISAPHDYWTAEYQDKIAALNVAVLSAYPGWGTGHGTTLEQTVKAIKAKNPQTKLFVYVIAESRPSTESSTWPGLSAKLDQQRWWVYQQFGGTTKTPSDGDPSKYVLNITPYSTKDSAGLRYNQWIAAYFADQVYKPSPSIDGFYSDNVFWRPRRDGDWNADGTRDSVSNATVQAWFRQGFAQYSDVLHSRMPGKLQIANIGDWGATEAVLTEYQNKFEGGVIEGMIGKNYSTERTAGWAAMMARYRKTMAALAAPKLALFQMSGDPTDYQAMRYGLGSCLLDDGYFAFNDASKSYYGVTLFDEYKVDLGDATTKPPTAAWSSGVYRRDFARGIVLVNPKGNGARDVTLETDFRKFQGVQDPATNNGKTVRTVHLNDRDGIILLRASVASVPLPPQNLSAQ